jgi:hypothetical protein
MFMTIEYLKSLLIYHIPLKTQTDLARSKPSISFLRLPGFPKTPPEVSGSLLQFSSST